VLGIALTQVQDPGLGLVELHEVRTGSPLKPVKVPLDGITSLQGVDYTAQFVSSANVLRELSIPLFMSPTKCWPQYRLLRNAIHQWSPLGHQAADHNSLSVTVQPIP